MYISMKSTLIKTIDFGPMQRLFCQKELLHVIDNSQSVTLGNHFSVDAYNIIINGAEQTLENYLKINQITIHLTQKDILNFTTAMKTSNLT